MRRALLVPAVAACLLASGCWMAPGHDGGRSGFNPDESTLTPDTIASIHQLWTTGGSGNGSGDKFASVPITDDQFLFFSQQNPTFGQDQVIARDAATGNIRWRTNAPAGFPGAALTEQGGEIYSSVAGLQGTELYSIEPGNGQIDAHDVLVPGPNGGGGIAPEVAIGRSLFAELIEPTSGPLRIDAAQGSFNDPSVPHASVTLPDGPFGAASGDPIALLPMAVSGNTFYAASAIRVWSVTMPPPPGCSGTSCVNWTSSLPGFVTSSPIIVDDQKLAVTLTGNQIAFIDRATGQLLWTAQPTFQLNPKSLAADGDQVYVTDDLGGLSGFSTQGCGQPVCSATTSYLTFASQVLASDGQVVSAGGLVYVALGTVIRAFPVHCPGSGSCFPVATLTTTATVRDLIVSAGRLYATTEDGVTAFGL